MLGRRSRLKAKTIGRSIAENILESPVFLEARMNGHCLRLAQKQSLVEHVG
jgi:hypothetical protein